MQVRHEMTDKIRRMRPTFYFLGLLIGLSATLAAFRWEVTTEIVKIPIEIVDSAEVIEILPFKIIDENKSEKTTKTKLVPPDPKEFKIVDNNVKTDTGITEKVVVNPDPFDTGNKPDEGRKPEDFGVDTTVLPWVGQMPYFEGGEKAWSDFINKNYITPYTVFESNITRINIVILCVVEKDGSLSNFVIAKDGGNIEAAQAFVNTLKKSPRWVPGFQGPRPVRVYMSIPFTIKLK